MRIRRFPIRRVILPAVSPGLMMSCKRRSVTRTPRDCSVTNSLQADGLASSVAGNRIGLLISETQYELVENRRSAVRLAVEDAERAGHLERDIEIVERQVEG